MTRWRVGVSLILGGVSAAMAAGGGLAAGAAEQAPIALHPDNPHYFLWRGQPTVSALAAAGRAYAIYLHVPLPLKPNRLADHLRQGIEAKLGLDLPAGSYRAEWLDTKTGDVAAARTLEHDGGSLTLASPPFADDVALEIRAVK